MPVATYEGMFLLDSTKAAAAWDDTVKHVHDILTKHQSEIVADCHLSDVILRELVLKVHPKLADHLVNQAMTSTPNVDAESAVGEEEADERPRRRRRDDRD